MSLKKKILVITSEIQTFPKDQENQVILLSSGCYPLEMHPVINNKFKISNYHEKITKKKVLSDYKYIKKTYDLLLPAISLNLNRIHKKNNSVIYWEILIGNWLIHFISILFDRWNSIKYINNNYSIDQINALREKKLELNNVSDFILAASRSSQWNNDIIISIIKYLNLNLKIKTFSNNKEVYFKQQMKLLKNNSIENFLKKIFNYFPKIIRQNDCLIIKPYFSFFSNIRLQLQFKQFPVLWFSPEFLFEQNKKKRVSREFIFNVRNNDRFTKFLLESIPKYMPKEFLEYFNEINKTLPDIKWPSKPKFIFTSNSFFYDTIFLFWLAQLKEKNRNIFLITGQHGGAFFNNVYNLAEDYQKKISDYIFSWGYKKKNIIPVFNFSTDRMSCKTDSFNNKKYLTILTYSIVPYFLPRRPYSNDDSRIFYIKNISLLINSLNYDISINLRDQIRSYKSDIFNSIIKNIKKDNIFIDKEKYFLKSINNSKLVVCTYDSTTYLQTLNLNIPTIIIISNKITNATIRPYYDKLKKAGILFDNPLEAAKKINAVYADVDKWWKNKDIQQVVNLFCYHFSRRTKKPTQELYKSFSKVIENVKN